MELGDLSSLKRLAIQRGAIFKMTFYPEDGIKPKNPGDKSRNKYFCILGITDNCWLVGSVLINTEINQNLAKIIKPYQHILSAARYDFLNGEDRFLDCYRISKIDFERIVSKAEYIDTLLDIDINRAIDLANLSPMNSDKDLKSFGIFRESIRHKS